MESLLTRLQIEEFLYHEASLLDKRQWTEWLRLFDDEATYWIPCNGDDIDPTRHVSIVYDDRKRLEDRVWRLETGQSPAQIPPSRTRHLITNVQVLASDDEKTVVSSNFIITELRRGRQTVYSGRFEHHLRQTEEGWKICYKKVELINNNEPLGNLSFIL